MSDARRLSIVSGEAEAEIVCGLLRAEGVRCFHQATDISAEAFAGVGEWREILVLVEDLERARELIASVESVAEECAHCGRSLGHDGAWFPNDNGVLEPYCGVCAERVFGSTSS